MSQLYKTILMCVVLMLALEAPAQQYDLKRAKSAIDKGEYTEGAKILRPLADGGNAEAQYMAAWLFFWGKGVIRSDEQGVKYATMAAEQGNMNAVKLLIDYCCNTSQDNKAVEVFGTYATKFPDMGIQLIRSIYREENTNCRKTVTAYFQNKKNAALESYENYFEKLYETNPIEGELWVEWMISSEGDDESCFNQLKALADQEGKTSKVLPILAKMTFEGRGTRQNYLKAMQYRAAAAENGSAMADFLFQKYGTQIMPGSIATNAVIFSVNQSAGTAMAFNRKTTECTWQNVKANLKQMGGWRIPTKEEAKAMMPYYGYYKKMKAGETITIWAVHLALAEVYYWQTYDHEGNLIEEEPYHNFVGSAYNGNVTLLTVGQINIKKR